MDVLSVEDIDLMIELSKSRGAVKNPDNKQKQIDKLIRMGIIRPSGKKQYGLTELGEKTAIALQAKEYVPGQDSKVEPVHENKTSGSSEKWS